MTHSERRDTLTNYDTRLTYYLSTPLLETITLHNKHTSYL